MHHETAKTGALFACLVFAFPAASADTRLPSFGTEPDAPFKLERFLSDLQARGIETGPLRADLERRGIPARDAIHAVLVSMHPEYRSAVAAFDRDALNAEELERLATSSLDPALRAHALFFAARAYLARDEFEKAAGVLEEVRGPLRLSTPWADEATFLLGYAYARTPELDEQRELAQRRRARHCLETLTGRMGEKPIYRDAPERLREGASWLLRELRGEGLGPLLELAKRMETIERLIDRERTDKPVQKKQEEVVLVIDRLIELMREKEQGGGGDCKGGKNCPGGKCKKHGKGPPQGNTRPSGPAARSTLPGGPDRVGDLGQAPAPSGETWGNLKDKDREAALQILKEKFPERYRELVEQYYKALAQEGAK